MSIGSADKAVLVLRSDGVNRRNAAQSAHFCSQNVVVEKKFHQLPRHGHAAGLMAGSSYETSLASPVDVTCSASDEAVGKLVVTSKPSKNEIPKAMNFVIVSTLKFSQSTGFGMCQETPFAEASVYNRLKGWSLLSQTLPTMVPYAGH